MHPFFLQALSLGWTVFLKLLGLHADGGFSQILHATL